MNMGKDFITVSVNININKVVRDAYEWALKNNQSGLIESYTNVCLKMAELKDYPIQESEKELFIDHTESGGWKTVIQFPDGRIQAVLITSNATIYADILYIDGEFRLMRYHF